MSTQVNEKGSAKPFWQDILAGGLSGIATVGLLQPMIYYKNMSQAKSIESQSATQAGKKWTLNPRALYRGGGGFAASFAPTIALQAAANSIFASWMNPLVAAAFSGAASSIVVNPAELIMIQQQKTGKPFYQTMMLLVRTAGPQVFFRGLFYTAGREGAFTGAYLGLTPYMKERFKEMGAGSGAAHMAAALMSGLFAGIFSQSFDTYKTRLQRDLTYSQRFSGMCFTKEAFAGLGWRCAMIVTATTALPFVQGKIKQMLNQE